LKNFFRFFISQWQKIPFFLQRYLAFLSTFWWIFWWIETTKEGKRKIEEGSWKDWTNCQEEGRKPDEENEQDEAEKKTINELTIIFCFLQHIFLAVRYTCQKNMGGRFACQKKSERAQVGPSQVQKVHSRCASRALGIFEEIYKRFSTGHISCALHSPTSEAIFQWWCFSDNLCSFAIATCLWGSYHCLTHGTNP